ncbi:hypothetical protein GCM10011317_44320 [Niveispirillum cyanobacteriorum]|nr:hypothetical protein GCM10011317_44320 [Niveispirillum cyanobacteriorum]
MASQLGALEVTGGAVGGVQALAVVSTIRTQASTGIDGISDGSDKTISPHADPAPTRPIRMMGVFLSDFHQ